ncbi:hypothetical protein Salat_1229400 [Sesamum alatum]|uniref:Uncharacterized protein n=1 Tax=Sesamum alatum TaxID=300844 RepID=A0AAE2CP26_9LAMI|nr:hypothetical protein Salat_1229400 [Sesamum alatum]
MPLRISKDGNCGIGGREGSARDVDRGGASFRGVGTTGEWMGAVGSRVTLRSTIWACKEGEGGSFGMGGTRGDEGGLQGSNGRGGLWESGRRGVFEVSREGAPPVRLRNCDGATVRSQLPNGGYLQAPQDERFCLILDDPPQKKPLVNGSACHKPVGKTTPDSSSSVKGSDEPNRTKSAAIARTRMLCV